MDTALSHKLAQTIAARVLPSLAKQATALIPNLPDFPATDIQKLGQDPAESLALLIVLLKIRASLEGMVWPESQIPEIARLVATLKTEPCRQALQECCLGLENILQAHQTEKIFAGSTKAPLLARFYEHLLSASDKALRKERGVYYTPPALIHRMVNLCDELCQQEFKGSEGLAENGQNPNEGFRVSILDPAAGTGLFLQGVFSYVKSKLIAKGRWNEDAEAGILGRLHGFELLYVPCQMARLDFEALCPRSLIPRSLMTWGNSLDGPEIYPQLREATVFLGNPPYAAFGQHNRSPWIMSQLAAYKDGLGEKKVNLDDDYIKFFRLAHSLLSEKECGLMTLVTNSSFIESPTRRQMRAALFQSFSSMTLLNLGGSRFRPRRDGEDIDENIFDIQCGIAVTALCRQSKSTPAWRSLTRRGKRAQKMAWLRDENEMESTWERLLPESPSYSFQPLTAKQKILREDYQQFLPLNSLFEVYGSGIKTDRDRLFFDRDAKQLAQRMEQAFSGQLTKEEKGKFRIVSSSSYDLVGRLKEKRYDRGNIRRCLYRPFDFRWLYYAPGFTSRPAFRVMKHMNGQNLALLAKRQARDSDYDWFFVSQGLIADGVFAIDNKGRESLFPLYLEDGQSNLRVPGEMNHSQNPLEFFQYIYALVQSPNYRRIYRGFLRQDYPRIPIPKDAKLFFTLVNLGRELITIHCSETGVADSFFSIDFDTATIAKGYPKFRENAVYLNAEQKIAPVSQALWDFRLGGHQIAEKWLKDRKQSELSSEEIQRYSVVLSSIAQTLRLRERVDHAIDEFGAWPGAFLASRQELSHGAL
ncbi:MAG: N-6 DNA methylase [Planctomycetota bacterium]|nr:N-6 DNA methylase [Planctomycetota bacterium]